MPTYDYRCKDCGTEFETTLTLAEHERGAKPTCPKCKSRKVEQVPTQFQTVTSKKA